MILEAVLWSWAYSDDEGRPKWRTIGAGLLVLLAAGVALWLAFSP